jgi:protein involved in polysaccharide export with SLBB domain
MKYLIRYSFAFFFLFIITDSFAQNVNPQAISQARMLLSSRGLNEGEVLARLKSKGFDVENMTEADFLKNRDAIQQIVGEMESEMKFKGQAPSSTSFKTETPIFSPKLEEPVNKSKEDTPIVLVKEISSEKATISASDATILPLSDIYGHKIFRNNSLEIFRTSKDASPPDSYVLASGDKINIVIFGKSQADLQYEINAGGFIQPTNMPKIFLNGLTLLQAKNLISLRFSTFYFFNKDQFALTLNTSRTLNVNIFGEIEKAGSFTTSALNTALNALSASGGPTNFGTVRNIQIIRGNVKKILDVYAFMRNPILQFDFYLQNNDIIYVSPAQKVVSLLGAVNRPMRYELIGKEGLTELLDFAGGIKTDALTDFIQLQRYENNILVLKDYPLKEILSGRLKLELLNGDVITIKTINSDLKTFVRVSGAVDYTGNYELSSTKTVKDLLGKAKLKPEAKTDQAFILRKRLDQTIGIMAINIEDVLKGKINYNFEKEDELIVYEQARFTDQFSIAVNGEVRNPFERNFRFDERLTIDEAIGLAGGLKNSALKRAYIYRTSPFKTKKTEYISINLDGLSNKEVLQPGDKLVIFNKNTYEFDFTVSIDGEVNNPQSIRFDSTLKIRDLLVIGGGTTIKAADFGYIYRTSPFQRNVTKYIPINFDIDLSLVLEPGDKLVVFNKELYQFETSIILTGDVKNPINLRFDESIALSDLIKMAGGLTPSSNPTFIEVFRLKFVFGNTPEREILKVEINEKFEPKDIDFKLQPFDIVVVRKIHDFEMQETVQITGEITNEGPYLLKNKKYHFSDLIKDAGGITQFADLKNTTLIRYNSNASIILFNAELALKNKRSSRLDPILIKGDLLSIPKLNNTISIETSGTNYLLGEGQKNITMTYRGNKTAKWYIKKFAGGFSERKSKIFLKVIRLNGFQESTKKGLIFKRHPRIINGDKIIVSYEIEKPEEKKDGKPFDWEKFMNKVLAVGTSIALITLYTK